MLPARERGRPRNVAAAAGAERGGARGAATQTAETAERGGVRIARHGDEPAVGDGDSFGRRVAPRAQRPEHVGFFRLAEGLFPVAHQAAAARVHDGTVTTATHWEDLSKKSSQSDAPSRARPYRHTEKRA
jgi:hypothetical protein